MKGNYGRITARLVESAEPASTTLISLINKNVNPPNPVTASDVHVRAMFVVSDEVNSFGGRFDIDEHERLARLLIDSPVMVGHRKDKLPLARTFHAEAVTHEGVPWVKAYFYWLKNADQAVALAKNIDGGIYKECSVAFTFTRPECSICGKDIRSCSHEPFEQYEVDDNKVQCHYNYGGLERVLETSLVYRGAVANTSIVKAAQPEPATSLDSVVPSRRLDELCNLPDSPQFLVTPFYDGLPATLQIAENGYIVGCCGYNLPVSGGENIEPAHKLSASGILVGFRGKERQSIRQLSRHLKGTTSAVSRVEFKLYPQNDLPDLNHLNTNPKLSVSLIRHLIVDRPGLENAVSTLHTRDGVRLFSYPQNSESASGYQYIPKATLSVEERQYYFRLAENDMGRIEFSENGQRHGLVLRQFSSARLAKGARFIADAVPVNNDSGDTSESGKIISLKKHGEGFVLQLSGILSGIYAIKPVRLEGQKRFLFYRIDVGTVTGR